MLQTTTAEEFQIPVDEEEGGVAGVKATLRRMRTPVDEAMAAVVEEGAGIKATWLRKMGTLMVNKDLAVVVEEGAQIRAIQLRKTPTLMADKKVLAVVQDEGEGTMTVHQRTMRIMIQHKALLEVGQRPGVVALEEEVAGIITGEIGP